MTLCAFVSVCVYVCMYVHVRVSRVRVCALAHVCDSDYAQVESDAYHAFAAIRTPGAARLTHKFVKRVVQVAATCVKARFCARIEGRIVDTMWDGWKGSDDEEVFAGLVTEVASGLTIVWGMAVLDDKTADTLGQHIIETIHTLKDDHNARTRFAVADNAPNMERTLKYVLCQTHCMALDAASHIHVCVCVCVCVCTCAGMSATAARALWRSTVSRTGCSG